MNSDNYEIKRAAAILRGQHLEADSLLGACIEQGLHLEVLRLSRQLVNGEVTEEAAFEKLKEFCAIAANSSFAELAQFVSERNGIGKPDVVLEQLKGLRIKRAYAYVNRGSPYSEMQALTIEFDSGEKLEIEITSLDWDVDGLEISLVTDSKVLGTWGGENWN